MTRGPIVILGGRDPCTRIVVNHLRTRFDVRLAILESPIDKAQLVRNRIKRLGVWEVIGQLCFILFAKFFLSRECAWRIDEIKRLYSLNDTEPDHRLIKEVESVNSRLVAELIRSMEPKVIVVHGTRIISKTILNALNVPAINLHAGITPQYRGVHGGYWALRMGDLKNCGVTVHLIDRGIDTGAVLYQKSINVTQKDNFLSYPYLQLAEGLPLLCKAIEDKLSGTLEPPKSGREGSSKLFYHPTLLTYLIGRIFRGVK